MMRTRSAVLPREMDMPSPKRVKSFREGVWVMTLFQKGLPQLVPQKIISPAESLHQETGISESGAILDVADEVEGAADEDSVVGVGGSEALDQVGDGRI